VKLRGVAHLYARSWASPEYPGIIRLRFRNQSLSHGADYSLDHTEALELARSLVAAVDAGRAMLEADGPDG
jgi:hypothetical protein